MEKVFEVNGDFFAVQFQDNGDKKWVGSAIECIKYDDGTIAYVSRFDGSAVGEIHMARVWFQWSFCWRGVWEGRVYFKDDEYWGEEMDTISKLWSAIELFLKDKIIKAYPDYKHFD